MKDDAASSFSWPLTLRLSSFHIGSAMGDVLTAGVWNRIMIADFGLPAWPIGLLIALRYFLSPLSIWAGHRSDTVPLRGRYRTPYIWFGRALMVLSFPLLGAATAKIETDRSSLGGWSLALACFVLYGVGTLLSGSPFLALVRDTAPREKQGLAIAFVETVLIAMFPVSAVGFGRLLSTYSSTLFWELILFVTVVGAFFWVFAVAGVEKRGAAAPESEAPVDLRATFGQIWSDRRTRRFFAFLATATFAAWMQDNILEPFAAERFDLPLDQTTRLTGYWGTATIVFLLLSFAIWRRRAPEQHAGVTRVGLTIMAAGIGLVGASALSGQLSLFYPALIVFGTGFGFYSFGGLSLMAAMSPDPNPGAYLGLWTISILVSKGAGTAMGGVLRDIFLALDMGVAWGYGIVFFIAALGLLAAVVQLAGVDVVGFVHERGPSAEARELALAGMEI